MTHASEPLRVFVAGATGVVGIPAVRALVADGHRVTGVARTDAKADELRALGANPVRINLFDAGAVAAVTSGHDVIVNLATKIPPTSRAWRSGAWKDNERIRTEVSTNLAEAAIAHGTSRMVQEALAFAYPDGGDEWLTEDRPIDPPPAFAALHVAEGNAARVTQHGSTGVVLRFGSFYGPTAGHTLDVVRMARRRISTALGDPDGYWPVIHVDDAAAAVAAAMRTPPGAFHVVDDEPLTKRDLDAVIADSLGVKAIRRPPWPALRIAENRAPTLARSFRASNAKFKAATGWSPRYPSAREGWAAVATALSTR